MHNTDRFHFEYREVVVVQHSQSTFPGSNATSPADTLATPVQETELVGCVGGYFRDTGQWGRGLTSGRGS